MEISFKTAKLAKKKGYVNGSEMKWHDTVEGQKPLLCTFNEGRNGLYSTWFENSEDCHHMYEAPFQSELQKWLREEYNLNICIIPNIIGYELALYNKTRFKGIKIKGNNLFQTYEECLEEGLIQLLNKISNKKN